MTSVAEVRLGHVAEFIRGINFKPDDVVPVGTEGSVVCMRTKNVQAELDCRDVWAVPKEFVRRDNQMMREGDILVSSANSWNLVGKCSWIPKLEWPASFGGFVSVLRANPVLAEPRYIYWWFASGRTQALLRSFGQKTTNISNLNIERSSNLKLPLPSLPEQRRIAAILDQADALRAKRREAMAQLDNLTQSIFIEMFGDPASNPMKWPVLPFESQIRSVRYGTGSPPPYVEHGIPFIRATNIKAGRIGTKDLRNISPHDAQKLEKCRVRSGNLIIVRSGVNTGDCAVIPAEYDGSCAAFDLIVDIDYCDGVFYGFLINSEYGRRLLEPLTRRAAQPHLNAEQLQSLPLIAPPAELRNVFLERISSVENLRLSHLGALEGLDILFASLQHRAFRGKL